MSRYTHAPPGLSHAVSPSVSRSGHIFPGVGHPSGSAARTAAWQLEPLPPPPDVGVSRGRRSCETSPESLTRQARDLSPRALQRRAVDLASQNTRLRGSRASSQAGRERRRQSDRPASGAAAGPVGEAWDRFRDEQERWAPSCGVLSDPKTGTINSDGRVESTLVYCDEQTNKL